MIDDTTYATKKPLGLSRQPRPLVDGNQKPLPAPSLAIIHPDIEKASSSEKDSVKDNVKVKAIFSDIYL